MSERQREFPRLEDFKYYRDRLASIEALYARAVGLKAANLNERIKGGPENYDGSAVVAAELLAKYRKIKGEFDGAVAAFQGRVIDCDISVKALLVLVMYFIEGRTLESIGNELGYTTQRIGQIKNDAHRLYTVGR